MKTERSVLSHTLQWLGIVGLAVLLLAVTPHPAAAVTITSALDNARACGEH